MLGADKNWILHSYNLWLFLFFSERDTADSLLDEIMLSPSYSSRASKSAKASISAALAETGIMNKDQVWLCFWQSGHLLVT